MRDRDERDQAAEDRARDRVPKAEALGDEVAGGGPQRKREQDRQPVPGFAPARDDRMDRQRALAAIPTGERQRERDAERSGARLGGDAGGVGGVGGDERADDADEDDDEPVDRRDVAPCSEL